MISEILIITDQLETLVRKTYRKEALTYKAQAILAKKMQDIRAGRLPPHFEAEGVHFYYIRRGSLYFVATSATGDMVMVTVIELLSRLYSITKDLCGMVTEESVRVNELPIFEMFCETVNNGYVQLDSTEKLRPLIQTKPVMVGVPPSPQEEIVSRMFGIDRRVVSASTVHRPAVGSAADDKGLYVDVVESLTLTTTSQGEVSHVKVQGTMSVRNELEGHPLVKVGLNDDLHVSQPGQLKVYGKSAQLDHCKFHPAVDTSEFDAKHVLRITASVGEFSAMTYSVDSSTVVIPILVRVSVHDVDNSGDQNVRIQVSPNFPHTAEAVQVRVTLPVPASVSSISQNTVGPSESLTFKEKAKVVQWTVRNLGHAQESTANIRLISHSSKSVSRMDIGPASVEFEVKRLTLSGLRLRYLKIFEGSQQSMAKRYVRYVTASDSYTVKIT